MSDASMMHARESHPQQWRQNFGLKHENREFFPAIPGIRSIDALPTSRHHYPEDQDNQGIHQCC